MGDIYCIQREFVGNVYGICGEFVGNVRDCVVLHNCVSVLICGRFCDLTVDVVIT